MLRRAVGQLYGRLLHPGCCRTPRHSCGHRLVGSSAAVERSYPQEPRVGARCCIRPARARRLLDKAGTDDKWHQLASALQASASSYSDLPKPLILLIRRAKPPSQGLLCFPGGSLELGETMWECAAREVAEETGLRLHMVPGVDMEADEEGFSEALRLPTPFAAVDAIHMDDGANATIRFHYAIVEVAALVHPADAWTKAPSPSDDASEAMWLPTPKLVALPDLVPMCARITTEALRRFPVVSVPYTG